MTHEQAFDNVVEAARRLVRSADEFGEDRAASAEYMEALVDAVDKTGDPTPTEQTGMRVSDFIPLAEKIINAVHRLEAVSGEAALPAIVASYIKTAVQGGSNETM